MLSHFAIGLVALLGHQALWSVKIPWYFHKLDRQECYNYHYNNIEKVKIRRTNVENIHLTYLHSNVLYVSVPYAETGLISATQIEIQGKRKRKLRLEIKTEQIFISGNGSEICLKPKEENEG